MFNEIIAGPPRWSPSTCRGTCSHSREQCWTSAISLMVLCRSALQPLARKNCSSSVNSDDSVQVSPAGHCPHAEAPAAVSEAMQMWISAAECSCPLPLEIGDTRQLGSSGLQLMSGRPRNIFERLDALAWSFRNKLFGRQ